MKNLLLILLILFIVFAAFGCTVQFKAKEIELEGHTNTTYEFQGFTWTEKLNDLQDSTD